MALHTTRRTLLAITVLAALLASGCSLAPDYHRPDSPVPLKWNQQEIELTTGNHSAFASPFFNDPRLSLLIQLTTAGNKDLELSALNLKKSGELYGIERLSFLPNVAINAQKSAAHLPAGIFDTVDTGAVTYQQYDVKLVSASWEIDFWGRLQSLKEASLNEYFAAGASARALKIKLIEQTVTMYFSYLSSRESVRIGEEMLKNRQIKQEMAHAAYNTGALSRSEMLAADKNVEEAEAELALLKLQAQENYNALQLLAGQPLPSSIFRNASIEDKWEFPTLSANLPSEVLLRRPDIVAAEYELKAANARIGAAKAAFFPSVSITADGGTSSAELGHLFSGGSQNWSFIPSINLPIFDGGKNRANLDIAELNKQAGIVHYQQVVQQAFRDVSNALSGQAAMKTQYERSVKSLQIAGQQYQMACATHDAGQLSKDELINQSNDLLDIRKRALVTRMNYLVQGVKLYSVLGGDNTI